MTELLYRIDAPEVAGFDYFEAAPDELFCSKCRQPKRAWRAPFRRHAIGLESGLGFDTGAGLLLSDAALLLLMEASDTAFDTFPIAEDAHVVTRAEILPVGNIDAATRSAWCRSCSSHASVLPGPRLQFEVEVEPSTHGFYEAGLRFRLGAAVFPIWLMGPTLADRVADRFPDVTLHAWPLRELVE
ncbi:MAG: hypothetical protein AAGA32_00150 [Pseudomonadota bacterium]